MRNATEGFLMYVGASIEEFLDERGVDGRFVTFDDLRGYIVEQTGFCLSDDDMRLAVEVWQGEE